MKLLVTYLENRRRVDSVIAACDRGMRSAATKWTRQWRDILPWIDSQNTLHLDTPLPEAVRESLITKLLNAIDRATRPTIAAYRRGQSVVRSGSALVEAIQAEVHLEMQIAGLMERCWYNVTFGCEIPLREGEATDLVHTLFWEGEPNKAGVKETLPNADKAVPETEPRDDSERPLTDATAMHPFPVIGELMQTNGSPEARKTRPKSLKDYLSSHMIGMSDGDVARKASAFPGQHGHLTRSTVRRMRLGRTTSATKANLGLLAKVFGTDPKELEPYADRKTHSK